MTVKELIEALAALGDHRQNSTVYIGEMSGLAEVRHVYMSPMLTCEDDVIIEAGS